ncbi:hypothetical protein [Kitasatospora purpeofusca]|uniref:hypothetical protein n=1 Tax=Kitasatospora purpeofusca TaxID=67352 RepID=UPI00364BDF61
MQRHLAGAQVAKALDIVFFAHLALPVGAPDRSALPVAGGGPAAVAAVVAPGPTLRP